MHPDSIAYDFFNGGSLHNKFFPVSPDAWIDDHRFTINDKIMEMAIPLPIYNQVLSFLCIDIDEENDYVKDDYCKELDGYPKFR